LSQKRRLNNCIVLAEGDAKKILQNENLRLKNPGPLTKFARMKHGCDDKIELVRPACLALAGATVGFPEAVTSTGQGNLDFTGGHISLRR